MWKQPSLCLFMLLFLFFLGSAGCAPLQQVSPESEKKITLYLVGHGWHTGIVIPAAAIPEHLLPVRQFYDKYEYFELSWGDEDFFKSNEFKVGILLKAALLPSASVMHVVGFNGQVIDYFPISDVIRLSLAEQNFMMLCEFINNSFDYGQQGEMVNLGPGLYGDSHFYPAHEKYYLPKTCNVWTAKALQRAGYPISPCMAKRSESLLKRMEKFGERLR